MQDINPPQFYDKQNIDDLIHSIHRAGFYNLSQLIKEQFQKIKELETEVEETRESAYDQGCEDERANAWEDFQYDNSNVENFASWYLKEFEPEHKKKIKFKTIGDTTFVIMTEDNYNFLKNEFHKQLD